MRSLLLSLLLVLGAPISLAAAQVAESSPIVVELFASQNCRACPVAHKTLKTVNAERDDLLVLTWSVDYWDYLGDADPMAMQDSKHRQKAYVERFGLRGPYTPQTVYNGAAQCPGNKPSDVNAALKKDVIKTPSIVRIEQIGNEAHIFGSSSTAAEVWFVEYLADAANSTDMLNPVTAVTSLGAWPGRDAVFPLPVCGSTCAVLVQEAGFGRVLAASTLAP